LEWEETPICGRPDRVERRGNEVFHPWTRAFDLTTLKAMTRFTILCHPSTPLGPTELEDWLKPQLDQLRASAPAIVRMSRLIQSLPSSQIPGGLLIEVELVDETHPVDHDQLSDAVADVIRDMRLLGMQPLLLFPHDLSELSVALGQALSGVSTADGPVLDYPGLK
jgi:hypothetical protein